MGGLLLLQGCAIGLAVAVPVGPNGVLCIRRTLAGGWRAGLVSGLGATTVHALYAALAASGLALVPVPAAGLRAAGGAFLCYLGWRLGRAGAAETAAAGAEGLRAIYLSTLLLTLANPLTIASFSALFASGGLASGALAPPLVAGVALGSAGWWCALSAGTSLLRGRVTQGHLRRINRASGAALLALGLLTLTQVLPQ